MKSLRVLVAFLIFVSILPVVVSAQITQLAELTASDGAAGDMFGSAVAVSGNTAVVGAPNALVGNGHGGAVYVFSGSGTAWTQVAKLTPSDRGNTFGSSVAICGSTIVVGAPDESLLNGGVYIFVEPPGGWADMTETAKLTATGAEDRVGQSVAIDEQQTNVAAAAYATGGYVWRQPAGGWANMSSATAVLLPPPSGPFPAIGISGNTVALLAISGPTTLGGAVFVYVLKPGSRRLSPAATLSPSDGSFGDYWSSVAISGDTIVAGDNNHNSGDGVVYAFMKPPTGWSDMTQTAELSVSAGQPNAELGAAVATSSRVVIAGAPNDEVGQNQGQGAFFGYLEPSGGWANTSTPNFSDTSSDGAARDGFGQAVSLSGQTIVGGAPNHAVNGNASQGAAYIFGPKQ